VRSLLGWRTRCSCRRSNDGAARPIPVAPIRSCLIAEPKPSASSYRKDSVDALGGERANPVGFDQVKLLPSLYFVHILLDTQYSLP
jgi:hypothetical protein